MTKLQNEILTILVENGPLSLEELSEAIEHKSDKPPLVFVYQCFSMKISNTNIASIESALRGLSRRGLVKCQEKKWHAMNAKEIVKARLQR